MPVADASGYSGKMLHAKFGVKPGARVFVRDAPHDYATLIGLAAADFTLVDARAAFDIAHVFVVSAADLAKEIECLARRLPASGVAWISWPKKSSGVATEVTEDTIRAIALPKGLVDVKVCAVDATWSALKLVWRKDMRAGKR